jgi:hypothetical protein
MRSNKNVCNPPCAGDNSTFKFQEIQVMSVLKNLSNLKTNKSTGLDRITARLLKDAAAVIAPSLTQIFKLLYFPQNLEKR